MDDDSNQDDSACIIRSGRASKPHDYSNHFPEMDHAQTGTTEGRWLKPHYCDEFKMIEQLGDGIFYNE